ncbi:MAG: FAD/NAD(P)-binding protein, partial [Burkholderiaceae bacterium]
MIVGGGFTGATVAVQAARRSPIAMDIVVVEPSTELG